MFVSLMKNQIQARGRLADLEERCGNVNVLHQLISLEIGSIMTKRTRRQTNCEVAFLHIWENQAMFSHGAAGYLTFL